MPTRQELVEGIATIITDYRENEIARPDPDHVARWLHQFDGPLRTPIITELHDVLAQTYLSKRTVKRFLERQVENPKLTGGDAAKFWQSANFLRIQKNGRSQRDLLKLFARALTANLGLKISECGGAGDFIYLDDILFSGNRIGNDLEQWIAAEAPRRATVHVLLMAIHEFGCWQTGNRLKKAARAAGKEIDVRIWRALSLENRKAYRDSSDVLWPTVIPEEAAEYVSAQRPPFIPRQSSSKTGIFSSEEGRQVLEQAFLIAGMHIRAASRNPSSILRPLGFGPFGVGFGSMIVTYRNCPNNAPLALWWGDPEAAPSHPFSKWRPLVPRKTYGDIGSDEF